MATLRQILLSGLIQGASSLVIFASNNVNKNNFLIANVEGTSLGDFYPGRHKNNFGALDPHHEFSLRFSTLNHLLITYSTVVTDPVCLEILVGKSNQFLIRLRSKKNILK